MESGHWGTTLMNHLGLRTTAFAGLLLAAAASHAAISGGTASPVHLKYAGRASPAAPALRSSAALVLDATHAMVLYCRHSDVAVPIASITKLMTALVVMEAAQPLDEQLEITAEDRSRRGRPDSRFAPGTTLSRGDLLHLALMSSENRAAHALGRNYPGGLPACVDAMNAKARELGMTNARFVEPTGLSDQNVASPEDLSKLVMAAAKVPQIREYSTDSRYEVRVGRRMMRYGNTDSLVSRPDWKIDVQKTGYISRAGRCLVMQTVIEDRTVVIVLLNSFGKHTRVADARPQEQRAPDSIEHAGVKEWPAHEGVGSADELGDFDFRTAPLDLETDGVADDREHSQAEQRRGDQQQPPHHLENGIEAHDPFGVDLHQIHLGPGAEVTAQRLEGCGGTVRGPGQHVQHVRQRILLERLQRLTESRVGAEVRESLVRRNHRHRGHVGALPRRLRQLLRLGERHVGLQVHRHVDGVGEVAGGELRIGDEQPQAGGQRERERDHQQRERRRQRAAREPAERAEQRLQVPGTGDREAHRVATTDGSVSSPSPPCTWPFSSTITR